MLHRPVRVSRRVPLDTRWIQADEEESYFRLYREISGLASPDRLLADGTIRAFFADGRMVAGYRLARVAERYPALFAADEAPEWPFPLDQAAEVSFLWMGRTTDGTLRRSVYAQLLVDLLETGLPHVLGGAVDPIAARQQQAMLPTLLHNGPVRSLGPALTLQVYCGTPASVLAGAFASGVPAPWHALR